MEYSKLVLGRSYNFEGRFVADVAADGLAGFRGKALVGFDAEGKAIEATIFVPGNRVVYAVEAA